jgi:hypothetical protein
MNPGLLYLCAFTGLIVVVGSLLLIWTGRIVIDKDGSVSEVQLPFGFRLHTQLPVVIMFFFGAFLLALPVVLDRRSLGEVPTLTLTGKIGKAPEGSSYKVYAVADDTESTTDVLLTVPSVKTTHYQVLYFYGSTKVFNEPIDWSKVVNDRYQLTGFDLTISVPNNRLQIPESSVLKEPREVVDNFHGR